MTPPSFIKPVTIRIRRSPNRNGARASETEPKISRFEAVSENSFFFILESPILFALGEPEEGHTRRQQAICRRGRRAGINLLNYSLTTISLDPKHSLAQLTQRQCSVSVLARKPN